MATQAKKQTTKTKPAAQAKTAPNAAKDELDDHDRLTLLVSQARSIVDAVRGSCYGEVLSDDSQGRALTVQPAASVQPRRS